MKTESGTTRKIEVLAGASHGIKLFLSMLLVLSIASCAPENKEDNQLKKSKKVSDHSKSEDSVDKLFFDMPKRTLKEAKKLYLKSSPKREKWHRYTRAAGKAHRADDYNSAALCDDERSTVRVKPIALNLRVDLLTKLGRHKEAIKDLTELLKSNPGEDELMRKRGDSYTALKEYSRALQDYNKAIALEPEFARPVYESRSKLYKEMGKEDLAKRDLEKALKMKATPAEKKIY